MIISHRELSGIARKFLKTIDRNEIDDLSDVEDNVGQSFPVSDDEREKVSIKLAPSNENTFTFNLSYEIYEAGVSLQAKINPSLEYTKVFARAESKIPGYFVFSRDFFQNLEQMKDLSEANMEAVRKELTSLVSLPS